MSLDPRLESIKYQLRNVRALLPVLSVKGGVGKSVVTMMLGLAFSEMGIRVGLLDLDLSNPTQHYLFGIEPGEVQIEEEEGYVAPQVYNDVRLSTPSFFAKGGVLPSRDEDAVEVLLELLAITNWKSSEIVLIDTPPGLHKEHIKLLEVLNSLEVNAKRRALIVTTPFKVSLLNVFKSLDYINSLFKHDKVLLINRYSGEEVPVYLEKIARCIIKVPKDELIDERAINVKEVLHSRAYREVKEAVANNRDCLL